MTAITPKLALAGLAAALALTSLTSCRMKQTVGLRDSGQSRLMDETFAGQNACNPDDHNRPFIIEWDATDMSYFESIAANDVVIVKYEGCKLRVLDECRNDNVRGSQGAYKPPEWTSGSLETIDVHNEGELYAKLPLAKASLGGRVSGGESFHMEYFVAGTVFATRDAVYTEDLRQNPGCDEATHFVYAYNLGAFALGSVNEINSEVGGSIYGFGAGGSHSEGSRAEKKGGDLGACRSDSATEISGCKTPIRLNLRKIRDGANPEATAMTSSSGDDLNAAGLVNMKVEMSDEARARLEAAKQKLAARDGAGCLTELDVHDTLAPKHKSTDPKVDVSVFRNQCLMLTGKCEAGRANMRKSLENHPSFASQSPAHIDAVVAAYAQQLCPADSLPVMDQMLAAVQKLQIASVQVQKEGAAVCADTLATIQKLQPKLSADEKKDARLANLDRSLYVWVPMCFHAAGACDRAWEVFPSLLPEADRERLAKKKDDAEREKAMRASFDSIVKGCAGK